MAHITYLEATSMKELAIKIDNITDNLGSKWNGMSRSINSISIEKDGDKFCAILDASVHLVQGWIDTTIKNEQLLVWVDGASNTLNVNVKGGELDGIRNRINTLR